MSRKAKRTACFYQQAVTAELWAMWNIGQITADDYKAACAVVAENDGATWSGNSPMRHCEAADLALSIARIRGRKPSGAGKSTGSNAHA